jgi:hypothetical protein
MFPTCSVPVSLYAPAGAGLGKSRERPARGLVVCTLPMRVLNMALALSL